MHMHMHTYMRLYLCAVYRLYLAAPRCSSCSSNPIDVIVDDTAVAPRESRVSTHCVRILIAR